ncbi:MAG: YebC/PmpR family DNA-binding transcriptional regulator [Clostridiales bacterium]|nr:YebC/PmpR family DNA-binding transcriptional regulator [Clostridiales bacterium]
MSGHSKWATIKRQKGKTDAARANVFTKIGRELAVAVKAGGPDPNNNPRLRDVIAKARAANMPNDNITRSIKKASGEDSGVVYTAVTYEGYGTSGVAVIVETLTDNKNRTAAAVRHIFDKCGGSLGTTNCVSYMFEQKGVVTIEKQSGDDDEELMMLALELGADDFDSSETECYVSTSPASLAVVRDGLEKAGKTILLSEVQQIPASTVDVDAEAEVKIRRMLDMFEEDDDVQNVYHNANLPDDEDEED